jgi:arylsulfatase
MRAMWRRAAIVAATGLGLFACEPPPRPAKNAIVVLVDTLRADRLSLYGYSRATSRHLERRARSAAVFETVRAQAPCTFPSVNSIFTSRDPIEFLGREDGRQGIPDGVPSWAEILARRGFATAAVSASFVVRDTPGRFNRTGGYGRGFERFDESCESKPASCVNARALALLDEMPEPFFLYLHYMEPHDPYSPPRRHRRTWSAGYRSEHAYINRGGMWHLKRGVFGRGEPVPFRARDLVHLSDLYDEEVAYFDAELERLMRRLEERGKLADTLVVLMSDHGEHVLFEHRQLQHCQSVYEEAVRTPLVVWRPGRRTGRRITAPVQNLDVLPTVLDLLAVPFTGEQFRGRSLRPLLDGGDAPARVGFAQQGQWLAAYDRRFKLIVDLESGERRLFDLRTDPGEHYDVAARHGAAVARLNGALVRWGAEHGMDEKQLFRRALAGEETLRAVGYL